MDMVGRGRAEHAVGRGLDGGNELREPITLQRQSPRLRAGAARARSDTRPRPRSPVARGPRARGRPRAIHQVQAHRRPSISRRCQPAIAAPRAGPSWRASTRSRRSMPNPRADTSVTRWSAWRDSDSQLHVALPSVDLNGGRAQTEVARLLRQAIADAAHSLDQRGACTGASASRRRLEVDVDRALLDEHMVPHTRSSNCVAAVHAIGMGHERSGAGRNAVGPILTSCVPRVTRPRGGSRRRARRPRRRVERLGAFRAAPRGCAPATPWWRTRGR